MNRSTEILYIAAGAGMGHLVRASAVCLALRDGEIRGRIVTHSRYAETLRRITSLTIDFIPTYRWVQDVVPFAGEVNPGLVVLDTFPWGLRGEWRGRATKDLQFAFIARRLNVASYLEAAGFMRDDLSHRIEVTAAGSSSSSQAALMGATAGQVSSGTHESSLDCVAEIEPRGWINTGRRTGKMPVPPNSQDQDLEKRHRIDGREYLGLDDTNTETFAGQQSLVSRGTARRWLRHLESRAHPHADLPERAGPALPLHGIRSRPGAAAGLSIRIYAEECPAPPGTKVIAAEPLNEDYFSLLQASGAEVHELSGRIRFPAEEFPEPVPEALERLLESGKLWLVVHSGPHEEVKALVDRAWAEIASTGSGEVAAVVPRPLEGLSCPAFTYFPAARLYDRAYRVLTGAGYNSVAEMAQGNDKHLCVPFPRRYDDQAARVRETAEQNGDGTAEAARLLASWLP